jgi:hypothetical protein
MGWVDFWEEAVATGPVVEVVVELEEPFVEVVLDGEDE